MNHILATIGLILNLVGTLFLALDVLNNDRLKMLESKLRSGASKATHPRQFYLSVRRIGNSAPDRLITSEENVLNIIIGIGIGLVSLLIGAITVSYFLPLVPSVNPDATGPIAKFIGSVEQRYSEKTIMYIAALIMFIISLLQFYISFLVVAFILLILAFLFNITSKIKDHFELPSGLRLFGLFWLGLGFILQLVSIWI